MAHEYPRREWNGRGYIWNIGPFAGLAVAAASLNPNDPTLDVPTIGGPLASPEARAGDR